MSVSKILTFTAIMLSAITSAATGPEDARPSQPERRIAWANSPDVLAEVKAVNLHLAMRGDIKNASAGETLLRSQLERRLREAGLGILTDDEAASEEVPVMLTVLIDAIGIEGDEGQPAPEGGVYLVRVMMDDVAVPVRDDQRFVLGATTWSRLRFGHARQDTLASKSMEQALALITEYCHDYLRAQQQ